MKSFFSPQELASYLDVPLGTIYKWRTAGTGPKGHKLGIHTRYRITDVDAWVESL